jgi:ferritin
MEAEKKIGYWRGEAMDEREYFKELRRREKKLLERIEKMRKTMNETVELNTLGFMSELLEEAKKELSMVQEKLSNLGKIED